MSDETTELKAIMDEFEHECFMLRVEASDTRARDDVVRKAYERIRDEFAGRIAATLGTDRESELQSALNKAAGNWAKADALLRERTSGTLTVEQVREAIERNFGKVAVLDDGGPVEWRDDWVCKVGINYKAIADELNARAERTCEFKPFKSGTNEEGERQGICSVCSAYMHEQFCFCPNCGCKVVER